MCVYQEALEDQATISSLAFSEKYLQFTVALAPVKKTYQRKNQYVT